MVTLINDSSRNPNNVLIRRPRQGVLKRQEGTNYINRRKEFLLVQITY